MQFHSNNKTDFCIEMEVLGCYWQVRFKSIQTKLQALRILIVNLMVNRGINIYGLVFVSGVLDMMPNAQATKEYKR